MTVFDVAFMAGRFDADQTQLARWLEQQKPALCGHTEVNNLEGALAFPRAGRNSYWPGGTANDRGNCAISWLPPWTIEGSRAIRVTDETYFRRGGGRVEMWAPIVVLKDDRGRRLVVSVLHAPSHVETGAGWRAGFNRVRVHRAAVRGWKRRARAYQIVHDAEARVLMGDFNVNYTRPVFKAWFKRVMPALRGADRVAHRRVERRPITRILVSRRLRVVTYRVMGKVPGGFDHRPIIAAVMWRKGRVL